MSHINAGAPVYFINITLGLKFCSEITQVAF